MKSEFSKIILDNEKRQHYNTYKSDRNYKNKKEKEEAAMEFPKMKKENNRTAAREMHRFFGFLVLTETPCCLCCCYDTGGNFFCK